MDNMGRGGGLKLGGGSQCRFKAYPFMLGERDMASKFLVIAHVFFLFGHLVFMLFFLFIDSKHGNMKLKKTKKK